MQYALRVLGYRMRSVAEMQARLQRKQFPPPVIARTLAKLHRLQLLDDQEFARAWVESRAASRGTARLKQELRQKGIARDVAEEIMASRSLDEERAAAWRIATRATHGKQVSDRPTLLRIHQALLRRGFSYDTIKQVCARLAQCETSDENDWLLNAE